MTDRRLATVRGGLFLYDYVRMVLHPSSVETGD